MRTILKDTVHFILQQFDGTPVAELIYTGENLIAGKLITSMEIKIEHAATGTWHTFTEAGGLKRIIAEIKMRPRGLISLYFNAKKKRYKLRNAGIYKNRFILCNSRQDEMLSLLPVINWDRKGHDYSVQINEEYNEECSPLLILHAVHCTNCYLGMLNGAVPALISI
jgi:hypothetical protein